MTKEEYLQSRCDACKLCNGDEYCRKHCTTSDDISSAWEACEEQMQVKVETAYEAGEFLAYRCEKKGRKQTLDSVITWLANEIACGDNIEGVRDSEKLINDLRKAIKV